MRIDPGISTAGNAGTNQVTDTTSVPRNTPNSISGEPEDTVKLSSAQAMVRQLVSAATQGSDVRQQKVDSLRAAIQSGQYQPSNGQIAGAIVNEFFGSAAKP